MKFKEDNLQDFTTNSIKNFSFIMNFEESKENNCSNESIKKSPLH